MTIITTKAGRLLFLYRLREEGILDDKSLSDIAGPLGVERSTILRDLRTLDQVEEEYTRWMAVQPWTRRDLEGWALIRDLVAATGYTTRHLRILAREGKVEAKKIKNRWWINRESLDKYIASRLPGPGRSRGAYEK